MDERPKFGAVDDTPGTSPERLTAERAMVRSELAGSHAHETVGGDTIYIWSRGGKYLARFRYRNAQVLETLASDPRQAMARLRQIMVEVEQETYVPARETRKRPLKHGRPPRQMLRKIFDACLADVRSRKGYSTFRDYLNRSIPVLEFAERPDVLRRYPVAEDIDRRFAVECRAFLFERQVAANGHVFGRRKRIAPGHVFNILLFASTALNWARRPDVNLLPVTFANPFTTDIIGERPRRDPLAPAALPVHLRAEMVLAMDLYQLCVLAPVFVLPHRPEDFAGLMLGEILWDRRHLVFGTRMHGDDHNKGRISYHVPFPPEFGPLLTFWSRGRSAGPVFLRRAVAEGRRRPRTRAATDQDVDAQFEDLLARAGLRQVQNENDRKRMFRRLLRHLGGVSEDQLAREFKKLLAKVRPGVEVRFYEARASVTTDLLAARIDEDLRLYFTGHSTRGKILASYQSIDPHRLLAPHFAHVRPILDAIARRSRELGLNESRAPAAPKTAVADPSCAEVMVGVAGPTVYAAPFVVPPIIEWGLL